MAKTVFVIIYSTYGHVKQLGEKIVEGKCPKAFSKTSFKDSKRLE